MSGVLNLSHSRRDFLRFGALAAGGLLLGVTMPAGCATAGAGRPEASGKPFAPNAFVRVGEDDTVTVLVPHSEMGQGTYTTAAMLVSEEMEADWSKVRAESAPVDPAYNHTVYGVQMTGGSTSTWTEFERLRKAGASARVMLVAAAAQRWGVATTECRAERGHVHHPNTKRHASFGSLAREAARLTPPKDVELKDPKTFTIVGRVTNRVDTPDKTNGRAVFGMDVRLPGMLVAVIARPPVFGGRMISFDADVAKATPGVKDVIAIPRGVAVVADGFHAARLGRDALKIQWDDGPQGALDSKTQGEEYATLARGPGAVARNDGDAPGAIAKAARTIEAVYDLPYLAHAPMEPLNCVADVRRDGAEVWVGTQFQTGDRDAAAEEAGLPKEQVKLHTTLLGGGFGRRAVVDSHFVREAVQLSKAVGRPVKVIWTREDDMRGGYYRPRAHHAVTIAFDASGMPTAWSHRTTSQSLMAGTPFEAFTVKDGVDDTAVEGVRELPYAIPNVRIEWMRAPGVVPVLWWRSVGHSHTAFVVETLVDEMAHAAGQDPVAFRRALLAKQPRLLRVLDLVAAKSGWGGPLAAGRGRGIAMHASFESVGAAVVEASVGPDGRPRVHRVVGVIDPGTVVNPDAAKAQVEGGTTFALSAALFGEITFAKGRVEQSNFRDYPILRMNEMPTVEAHVMDSGEKMGGVGEPCVPPVAPALANALFAVTGKRIRRLPIRAEDLR